MNFGVIGGEKTRPKKFPASQEHRNNNFGTEISQVLVGCIQSMLKPEDFISIGKQHRFLCKQNILCQTFTAYTWLNMNTSVVLVRKRKRNLISLFIIMGNQESI